MLLNHELVVAPGAEPKRLIVFLHGILGTGANLRSHAKRLVSAQPDSGVLLMDLRAHGQSLGVEGADTVENAAADVAQTARTQSLPVEAVVGHSFGGKVALAIAAQHPELKHVVTLDSAPGPRLDARGSESTVKVVTMLRELRGPWARRDDFVSDVEAHGLSKGLAQWLGMNLERREAGFEFTLELNRIDALLDDYFRVDLWPLVERAANEKKGPRFHLVIGTKSKVYEHDDRIRAQQLESKSEGYVTVDLLDAGHWVHVDDAQGVAMALQHRLTF
ncbi:MAG: hypothetical protein DI536_29975 [Archangium gephyra]|uniref:AB hydrolase-1 domain-containing protein n=1 Tax=Archangium gephyra TaxID=48 RepID=A0A2W5UC83_9BACT|nr:MAG: hypothetical protein DI536_29975 [Archangium gephyra]